jgi:hypothetical protein
MVVDFPGSQTPETEGLLSENVAHEEPVFEQQEIYTSMGLSSQDAAEDGALELTSPKDPNHMQISKTEGRQGDTVGLGLVVGGAAVGPVCSTLGKECY